MERIRYRYGKTRILKNGKGYDLSFYGVSCAKLNLKEYGSYVSEKEIDGEKYVVISKCSASNKKYELQSWLSSGPVSIARDRSYKIASDFASNQERQRMMAEDKAKRARQKAEADKKKAEQEKKWKAEREAEERVLKAKEEAQRKEEEARLQYEAKLKQQLLAGERPVTNAMEYALLHSASTDTTYQYGPPYELPKVKMIFDWEAQGILKRGGYYFFWDRRRRRGFAFKDIVKVSFGSLHENGFARVVGEYGENLKISLVNGEEVLIPVLVKAYVDVQ